MRDCKKCKHLVMFDYKNKSYSCESGECEFDPVEQEPTTKNDLGVDCIDRDSIKYYPGQGGYMYASKGEIDKLPSVTPQEPKTGHWVYGYAFPDGQYCRCSECEELIKCIYPMHYCPNCGAKMAESEET